MSSYWNKISLNRILDSASKKKVIGYKINTNAGRFYFYFKKESDHDSMVSCRVIFFPK